MPIQVEIPAPMREHTDGQDIVEATGGTVAAVIANVGEKYPSITDRLFDDGKLRRFVNLFVNDEDIRYLDDLDTEVKDGDKVSIIPAVAGG
ncbi:MAG: ubiquitin-like small modifier protein 1 [Gemmataceae bacterium]